AAERQVALLEQRRQQNGDESRRRSKLVVGMQQMLKTHVADARSQLQQLRREAKDELGQFQRHCQVQVEDCVRRLKERQGLTHAEESDAQRKRDNALKRSSDLEKQLAAAERESKELEQELQQLRLNEAAQEEERAGLGKALRSHSRNVERVLSAVAAALPCGPNLETAKARLMAADGLTSPGFSDVLALLQNELESAFERARAAAAQAERERAEGRSRAQAQSEAALAVSVKAEASSELAQLQARQSRLADELQHRKASAKDRAELRAARLAELGIEASEQEFLLEAAEHRARSEEAEAERLSAKLHAATTSSDAKEAALAVAEVAAEPLRQRLRDVLDEVGELERRFDLEKAERERIWEGRAESEAKAQVAHAQAVEERLQEEARQARLELSALETAELSALETSEAQAAQIRQRLAQSQAELEDTHCNRQRLEASVQAVEAEEEKGRRALEAAERRLADAQKARRAELEELDSRRARLRESQELELDELRRSKEQELSQARSVLHQSLSSISAIGDEEGL
ncbi:unnamed protein product, partial [Polarella glacialis]